MRVENSKGYDNQAGRLCLYSETLDGDLMFSPMLKNLSKIPTTLLKFKVVIIVIIIYQSVNLFLINV